MRNGLSDVFREDVEQNLLPAFGAGDGRNGLDGCGQRDSGSGLREVDGDGARIRPMVVTTSKKMMDLSATRPTPRSSL